MQDILAETLLGSPPGGAAVALPRLAAGRLWSALLPGTDSRVALRILGPGGADVLATSLSLLPDLDCHLASAGLPFAWDGSPADLACALLADATRIPQALSRPGDMTRIEIALPSRTRWEEATYACLDHAADEAALGRLPDPLDALLVAPDVDLRPIVGIADADTRIRFVEGMAAARGDGRRFRRTYFRRSAAQGILVLVASILEGIPAIAKGRSDDGWPCWIEVAEADAARVVVPHATAGAPTIALTAGCS